jgi:murein DD-endopeptidase MepM/ murein hydrolase activator NlpD
MIARGASTIVALGALAAVLSFAPRSARAAELTYDPPGKLVAGSGTGRVDMTVYAPGIRFPIEKGPAFANSQVWGHGGMNGDGGQCDTANYAYPWHDNFCETRDWDMPLCPGGQGHQGQDIRPSTCQKGVHTTVAVTDGTITSIGSYTVYLTAADGTRFDYLHMQDVVVKVGDVVKRGAPMGKVSNQFGGSATTIHLHFNVRQNVSGVGMVFVPPYLSLVQAYTALMSPEAVVDAGLDAGPAENPPPPLPQHDAGLPEEGDAGLAATGEADAGCACSAAGSRSLLSSEKNAGYALVHALALLVVVRLRTRRERARRDGARGKSWESV